MSMKKGDRIGVIKSSDDHEIHFLGYGTFDGKHDAPFGPYGTDLNEYMHAVLARTGTTPPPYRTDRILMDDGRILWCEKVFWAPEAAIKEMLKDGRKVIDVVAEDAFREARHAEFKRERSQMAPA